MILILIVYFLMMILWLLRRRWRSWLSWMSCLSDLMLVVMKWLKFVGILSSCLKLNILKRDLLNMMMFYFIVRVSFWIFVEVCILCWLERLVFLSCFWLWVCIGKGISCENSCSVCMWLCFFLIKILKIILSRLKRWRSVIIEYLENGWIFLLLVLLLVWVWFFGYLRVWLFVNSWFNLFKRNCKIEVINWLLFLILGGWNFMKFWGIICIMLIVSLFWLWWIKMSSICWSWWIVCIILWFINYGWEVIVSCYCVWLSLVWFIVMSSLVSFLEWFVFVGLFKMMCIFFVLRNRLWMSFVNVLKWFVIFWIVLGWKIIGFDLVFVSC